MPNIRDPDAFWDGVWDWEMLDGCFGDSRIRPTDIDGFVERYGHFLVLEAKSPGVDIPEGQWRTFQALRDTGLFTILVIWGPKNEPRQLKLFTKEREYTYQQADTETLRNIVAWWYELANNRNN